MTAWVTFALGALWMGVLFIISDLTDMPDSLILSGAWGVTIGVAYVTAERRGR